MVGMVLDEEEPKLQICLGCKWVATPILEEPCFECKGGDLYEIWRSE